jgi:polyisoprenyl-teichoic acid--peptidoglycan teichoic acid transferase
MHPLALIRRERRGPAALTLVLAALVAACGSTPAPTATSSQGSAAPADSSAASADASPSAVASPSDSPSPSVSVSPSPSAAQSSGNLLGTDGRFTILLLGSDYRPSSPGNRTDAIMVVSLDPATGKTGVFSIPRDTYGFPLPNGGRFNQKVNALFQWYQTANGNGLGSLEKAISKAYGIEIDYGVLTSFAGVRNLVNAVGGVKVTLAKSYYDAAYWVNAKHQGWGLSAGTHQLDGETALIFARSRKGDNDFNRARRQQQLVAAALTKVLALGPGTLPTLVDIATHTTVTDLPLNRVAEVYAIVKTAKLSTVKSAVFGPTSYASSAGGTNFTPKIAACRSWIAHNFPPAKPGATWPAAG